MPSRHLLFMNVYFFLICRLEMKSKKQHLNSIVQTTWKNLSQSLKCKKIEIIIKIYNELNKLLEYYKTHNLNDTNKFHLYERFSI